MSDLIVEAARIAFEQHEKGNIDRDTLTELLEKLIDARAIENGYAEQHGLPSEQGARLQSKPEDDTDWFV